MSHLLYMQFDIPCILPYVEKDCHEKYGPPKNGPPSHSMDAAGAILEPALIRDVFLYSSLEL